MPYNFKRKEEMLAAKELAIERLLAPVRDIGNEKQPIAADVVNYWLNPDGNIPAGTVDSPSAGKAFILEYDTNAGSWARVQMGTGDASSIDVYNIGPEISAGTGIAVKVRGFEDAYGVMFVKQEVRHVRLQQVGGLPGSDTTTCSFTYNAFEIGSIVAIVGSPFAADPQLTDRQPNLKLRAAPFGHLFGDKLQVIEMPDFEVC